MRVLAAYGNPGWFQAWTLPADPAGVPESASIVGNPYPRAAEVVAYKGPTVLWDAWAHRLASRSPYRFWFSVVDVPDAAAPHGDIHDALAWLRSQDGLFAAG